MILSSTMLAVSKGVQIRQLKRFKRSWMSEKNKRHLKISYTAFGKRRNVQKLFSDSLY